MRLDSALAEEQPPPDAGVRQPLGHQPEHLALAIRQLGERPLRLGSAEQASYHLGVESRPSARDALRGIEKLGDREHTVLQQVPEATVACQLDDVRGLHVL